MALSLDQFYSLKFIAMCKHTSVWFGLCAYRYMLTTGSGQGIEQK